MNADRGGVSVARSRVFEQGRKTWRGTAPGRHGGCMAMAVIRVPESESHPAITHEATRRSLSEAGLPGDSYLMRFRPLAEGRVVPVPRLLDDSADPAELDDDIGGLLAIGHLLIEGEEADHIVLDGATGRVFTMYLFEKDPDLIKVLPLAPSVAALGRSPHCPYRPGSPPRGCRSACRSWDRTGRTSPPSRSATPSNRPPSTGGGARRSWGRWKVLVRSGGRTP